MLDNTSHENELLDALSWRLLLPIIEKPRVLSIMPPDIAYLNALSRLFGDVTSLEPGQSPTAGEEAATITGQVINVDGGAING